LTNNPSTPASLYRSSKLKGSAEEDDPLLAMLRELCCVLWLC
jgi:hypothetical protein